MDFAQKLVNHQEKLSVIGLGYVGIPIAVAFSRKAAVIGYDCNRQKIALYKKGIDPTGEVGNDQIAASEICFTNDPTDLRQAKFHIVAVPTPVKADHTPDLTLLEQACQTLGTHLTRGSIVVFESTVYPGVTEDVCIPILESVSGFVCGRDFQVGYSPERINPGDRVHRLENIVKIVSAVDEETLDTVAKVYELVVEAGVYRAESIRVAEAAKVVENAQRDINIAFMNELSHLFHHMNIDTQAVLRAAGTKWNFLNFVPGLVGGHCIGVDPYYLTYVAEQLGCQSRIILASRIVNDEMGKYVAENAVKKLIEADIPVKNARVAILGFSFKENCTDVRNTRAMDIYRELEAYGITPLVCDPVADAAEAQRLYQIRFHPLASIQDVDAVILTVSHDCFRGMSPEALGHLYSGEHRKVLIDVKATLDQAAFRQAGYLVWRL